MSRAKKTVEAPVRACVFCRCTDDRACSLGCSWVEDLDACSACVEQLVPAMLKLQQVLTGLKAKNPVRP